MADFKIEKKNLSTIKSDCLVIAGNRAYAENLLSNSLPDSIAAALRAFLALGDFPETGRTRMLYSGLDAIPRILILHADEAAEKDALRNAGAAIVNALNELKIKRLHLLSNLQEENVLAICEGIAFRLYSFDFYKSGDKSKPPAVKISGDYSREMETRLLRLKNIFRGIHLTRDLANEPSNELTPELLVKRADLFFKNSKNIGVSWLDIKALKKLKMNALLAVARGSRQKPYLLKIHYKPAGKSAGKICLVGKGVTFDSGGISIKPSSGMEDMKFDMSGAAAVIGSMAAVAALKPGLEIIGIVPAVENMPGSKAYKPGDVIRSMAGKSVEVINTDAEGRMILIDALTYAQKEYKPDCIVDFATLTGACAVALGDKTAGMFGNNGALADILFNAGEQSGDRVWHMPLFESYAEDLKSDVADLKHIGSRYGGAITAAKFLQAFIENVPWVHLDIAGVAYNVKNMPYLEKGSSGFGPRLIAAALPGIAEFIKKGKK